MTPEVHHSRPEGHTSALTPPARADWRGWGSLALATPGLGQVVVTAQSFGKIGVKETATMTLQDHITHIGRAQEELRRFCTETRRPGPAPWPFAIGGMIVGAALFGAGMGGV